MPAWHAGRDILAETIRGIDVKRGATSGVAMAGVNRVSRRPHSARYPTNPAPTKPALGQLDGAVPPKGLIYNYPPRGSDEILSISAAPAPRKIAVQIYLQATMTKMIAHCTQQGKPVDAAIGWAASELGGFMRA